MISMFKYLNQYILLFRQQNAFLFFWKIFLSFFPYRTGIIACNEFLFSSVSFLESELYSQIELFNTFLFIFILMALIKGES